MPAEAVSRVTLQEIRMYQSHELHRVKLLMPALCRIRQGRKVVSWEGHIDTANNNQIILFPSGYEFGIANYPDAGFYLAEMLYLPVVSTTGKKWVFRNLGGRKSMKLFS